jgi:sulfur carrier protein ThiS
MMSYNSQSETEEANFVEFRRKVRSAEVLSPTLERLLQSLHFTGRVSVVVQNGHVLKSGYEEGYFRQRPEAPL